MVRCEDCRHFRRYPFGETHFKRKTGCWHPDLMEQTQDDHFLKEQEIPGNHVLLNAGRDCAKFEARPVRPSFLQRFWTALRA